jgi:hypothetical protein
VYHCNVWVSRPNRRWQFFSLNKHISTFESLSSRKVNLSLLHLLITCEMWILKYFQDMKRSQEMLSSQRFIILVAFDNLRNVIDIMTWRIRIFFEGVQLLVLRDLSNEFLEICLLLWFAFFNCAALLLSLLLPLLPGLDQLLLLFSFFLNVKLHFCNFILD